MAPTDPSIHDTDRRDSSRGKGVVLLIVGVALLAGVVSVTWWTTQLARQKKHHPGTTPAPAAFDRDAAQRELDLLENQVQAAASANGVNADLVARVEALTQKYPDFAGGHRALGNALVLHGNRASAYAAYEKSLALDPRQAELSLNAGTLAFDAGDFDSAQRHYDRAVSVEPGNTRYLWHLAKAQIARQEFDAARNTLLRVLSLDSTYDLAYAALAELYKKQNKLTPALVQIDKAIAAAEQAAPKRVLAHKLAKAQILRSDNRPDEAMLVIQALEPADKLRPEVLDAMAQCWAMRGRFDRAAWLYEEVIPVSPLDWRLPAAAARWRIKAGDTDQARRLLDDVRRIDPRAPAVSELEELLK